MCNIFFLFALILSFSTHAVERPKWLTDTRAVCEKSQICVVGMGESRILAEASARSSLAKVFEVKVSSVFNSSEVSDDKESVINSFENIREETSLELEGVTFSKYYLGEKYHYALAVLNKHRFASSIKSKLDKSTSEIRALDKDSNTGSIFKISKLLIHYRILASRYQFLTGMKLAVPMTFEQLESKKREATRGVIVHVYIEGDKSSVLTSFMGELLTSMGFEVTKGKIWNRKATHLLGGKIVEEKVHFKVKGFEKYKYLLTLDAQNRKRIKSGSLSLKSVISGRSKEQIREKTMNDFKLKIQEDINKISFKK
jgi:hypothetical protein